MPLADPHCHTVASRWHGHARRAGRSRGQSKRRPSSRSRTTTPWLASKKFSSAGEGAGLIVVAGQEITTKWPATHARDGLVSRKAGQARDVHRGYGSRRSMTRVVWPSSRTRFMPVYFGSIQPYMLQRLLDHHHVDGIEDDVHRAHRRPAAAPARCLLCAQQRTVGRRHRRQRLPLWRARHRTGAHGLRRRFQDRHSAEDDATTAGGRTRDSIPAGAGAAPSSGGPWSDYP